jgi:hypothetical protein
LNGVDTLRFESHSGLSEFVELLAVTAARLAAARPIAVKPSVFDDDDDDIDVSQSLVVLVVLLLLNDDDDWE